MTGQNFATTVRTRTGTTSTTYTDAAMLIDANNAKDFIAVAIEKKNPQYFVIPALFDLVASTISAREYALPEDLLSKIVTVELEFDSSHSPFKYVPANPYPGGIQQLARDIGGITEENITGHFSNSYPYYILTRKGIYILSGTISAVTNGGKLRYKVWPADLANFNGVTSLSTDPTSTSFGIPQQFHDPWATLTSIYFKSNRPNPLPLSEKEQRFDIDLEKALESLMIDDLGGELVAAVPQTNWSGDNGAGQSWPPRINF